MRKNYFKKCAAALAALVLIFPMATAQAVNTPVDLSNVKTAMIAESVSGQLIMEKNSKERVNVAGLTRLPSLLLVCELIDEGALNLSEKITVSEAAAAVKGPTAFVEPYEEIAASELLKAAVMIGAGDAVYALAEAATGSAEVFVERLNERLHELNIDVSYTNITGDSVLLSASDLAILGCEAVKSEAFRNYATLYMDGITHENGSSTELVNSNRLIRSTTGCLGVGTGSSDSAGYCGIFFVQRGETAYVCALTGAPNSSARFSIAQSMIEYAFGAYKTVTLARAGEILVEDIPVKGGAELSVNLAAKDDSVLLLKQNEEYSERREIPETLYAPLTADAVAGTIEYLDENGNLIAVVELVPQRDVMQAGLGDFMRLMFLGFLHA
ncbi:MAG TPA: serine hydrolase [Clostridia bacterium]|nr:serine hydrolase [Clostridia bacterium]